MFFKKKKVNRNIDIEFNRMGFTCITDPDDKSKVVYRKLRDCNNKYHYIEISKHTGKTLIFSYQVKRIHGHAINKCVPLTYEEMELCLNKIKEMGWDK